MTSQNNQLQVFKGAWEELENAVITDNEMPISSNPRSFFIKPDGTEIFVVSNTNVIQPRPLSIPWDLNTLGAVVNAFTITDDAFPVGLFFKDDGTKMFVVGQSTKRIYEYTLVIPWDPSSIVASPVSISLSAVAGFVLQCAFSRDGDFLFITNNVSVYSFPLPTPWDVTSNVSNVSFTPVSGNVDCVTFKREGDKMYLGDQSSITVTEYDLSTVYDITTATLSGNTFTFPPALKPTDIFFKPDGIEFFLLSAVMVITKYNLDTSWNIATASHFLNNLTVTSNDIRGVSWRPDGLKMYFAERDTDLIREFITPTPWNITTAVAGSTFDISLIESNISDLWWKPDGTRLYIIGIDIPFTLIQLNASTPFDVSTLSDSGISFAIGVGGNPVGLFFRDDGNKMYLSTFQGDIREYNLTAWDITTLALDTVKDITPVNPQAVFFKYDGMQLYVLDFTTQSVIRFELSTRWSIATAVPMEAFDISSQFPAAPLGMFVRYDGEKMFVGGSGGVLTIFSYDLSSKFNNTLINELGDELVNELGEFLVYQ